MKTKFFLREKPYVPGTSCFESKHIRSSVCLRVGAGSGDITKGHELLEDDVYVHCQ